MRQEAGAVMVSWIDRAGWESGRGGDGADGGEAAGSREGGVKDSRAAIGSSSSSTR